MTRSPSPGPTWKERKGSCKLSSDLHTCAVSCATSPKHTHTIKTKTWTRPELVGGERQPQLHSEFHTDSLHNRHLLPNACCGSEGWAWQASWLQTRVSQAAKARALAEPTVTSENDATGTVNSLPRSLTWLWMRRSRPLLTVPWHWGISGSLSDVLTALSLAFERSK